MKIEKAKQIGMTDSYFDNPVGMDWHSNAKIHSTAHDIAKLTQYAMANYEIRKMSGLDIEDSKCNCENCDSKGCNTNYDCNNLNCDNIDSKVISSTSDNKNIIQHDIGTEPEVDVKTDISIESKIDAQPDASSVIEVDFENSTKPTTDANSSDDEYNSEVDTIIDDNEKDDK